MSRRSVYALVIAATLCMAPTFAQAQAGPGDESQSKCGDVDRSADPEAQIAACTAVLRMRPAFADAYSQRGAAYAAKGEFIPALADFNRALSLRRSAADLMNRAGVFMAKQDYEQAIADTDKAAALAPDDPRIESSRCWKRAVAGIELDVARAACERAMQMAPNDPNIYDSRGLALLKQRRFTEAFTDYDKAVSLSAGSEDRNRASFLFGRGVAQLRLDKSDAGEEDIDAALAINRNISTIYALNGVTR